jgi:GT2 family glycosyltransferase
MTTAPTGAAHVTLGRTEGTGGAEALLDMDPFQPVVVTEVELTSGLRSLYRDLPRPGVNTLLVLVRVHSQPIGWVLLEPSVDEPEQAWPATVAATVGHALAAHLAADEAGDHVPLGSALWQGWETELPPCLAPRRAATRVGTPATVVVATRERPEPLVRCLHSLLRLRYPDFEIVVVDNDPETDRTHQAVLRVPARIGRLRYVRAERRGLAAAHNRGLEVARGEVIAFTDDDVIVDRHWLAELVAPFVVEQGVAGAAGLIVPAELETQAQVLLETHGRYDKGYEPRLFDLDGHHPGDVLFPFNAGSLGSGANMAFDAEFLRRVGGFDPALGAGTLARGGDDLAALFRVVASGRTLAYRPGAIIWHHHHRDLTSVRRQAYGYAIGLGAYLTSIVADDPVAVARLLRRVPAGLSLLRARQHGRVGGHWPADIKRLEHRGMLVGPLAYLASRARGTWHGGVRPHQATVG